MVASVLNDRDAAPQTEPTYGDSFAERELYHSGNVSRPSTVAIVTRYRASNCPDDLEHISLHSPFIALLRRADRGKESDGSIEKERRVPNKMR